MEHKRSGIDWIPEVPEDWELRRLGTIGRFSKGGNISRSALTDSNDGVPAILYGDIYTKYDIKAELIINRISKKTSLRSVEVKKGDLLFTGSGETKEDIGKCIIFNSDQSAFAGGDVIIFKQEIFDSNFISYSQNSSLAKYQKAISSKGDIIVHTYGSKLRDVTMPYPSLPEQKTIAAYLDKQSYKIRSIIGKKGKFIELLKEQRQSIITAAVTKGTDEKVSLKETLLGRIPEHWNVRRLKFLADVRFSTVDKHTLNEEKKVRLCNYLDVYKHEYITNNFNFMEATASEAEIKRFTVEKGDVIITKDSETPEDIAVPAMVIEDLENVVCGYHLAHIKPKRELVESEFLFRLFQSKRINSHFEVAAKGVTRYGLSYDDINSVFLPYPPTLEEQQSIIKHIQTETRTLDIAISKAEREIELIKEYREAMIAEAVTGKMKL